MKLKSKNSPLTLSRGRRVRVESRKAAGVIIRLPRDGVVDGPLSMTCIELVVDGEIVDLNRIPLPDQTLVVDNRFKDDVAKK